MNLPKIYQDNIDSLVEFIYNCNTKKTYYIYVGSPLMSWIYKELYIEGTSFLLYDNKSLSFINLMGSTFFINVDLSFSNRSLYNTLVAGTMYLEREVHPIIVAVNEGWCKDYLEE